METAEMDPVLHVVLYAGSTVTLYKVLPHYYRELEIFNYYYGAFN